MKYIKIALIFITILVSVFFIVANFSAKETRFSCVGSIKIAEQYEDLTIYVKIHRYRPWVGLWSDSAGILWVEIPNRIVEYHEHIEVVGDQLQIYDVKYYEVKKEKGLAGNFSMLSKVIARTPGFRLIGIEAIPDGGIARWAVGARFGFPDATFVQLPIAKKSVRFRLFAGFAA